MATRYLTALDYSDWHTNEVLKKHAKKRPLGDLETRYHYQPAQPVLSCRTVDIDVSGTRTYRPRSTTDILEEQHKLIHSLFKKTRAASSAPPRRTPKKGLGLVASDSNNASQPGVAKIRIQGRPYTTQSETSAATGQKPPTAKPRPKTSGRLQGVKPSTDSFMVLKVDEDLLESRRSQNDLTNQIHAHWRPENSNLNQGHFMRGQKRPDDVPPTLDAWLTFGGAAGESGGVVDAFANFQNAHDYYNIEGSVGSRVAYQLQKGDRIRIGINGEVLTHDLKVKKWVKADPGDAGDETKETKEGQAEQEEREKGDKQLDQAAVAAPASSKAKDDADDDLFGELVFDSLEDVVQLDDASMPSKDHGHSKKKVKSPEFPLNWDDQLTRPEVKVISARATPRDHNRESLCESHPVLFEKLIKPEAPRPKLASAAPCNGYRVKQRPVTQQARADLRQDAPSSKVKAITFDPNSAEDEQRLSSISVDDVIQMRIGKAAPSLGMGGIPKLPKAQALAQAQTQKESGGEESPPLPEPASPPLTVQTAESQMERLVDKPRSQSSLSGKACYPAQGHRPRDTGSARASSTRVLGRPGSSLPAVSRELDLSFMTHSARTRRSAPHGGFRGGQSIGLSVGKAMAGHRGAGGGTSSINTGPIPGDTEFIQIAQPIRNPNSSLVSVSSSGVRSLYSPYSAAPLTSTSPPRSNTPLNALHNPSPETSRAPTPQNPASQRSEHDAVSLRQSDVTVEQNPPNSEANVPESSTQFSTSSGPGSETGSGLSGGNKAISIPTGSRLEEDDEEELTVAQRRERSMRDQQIHQITHLLGEAILGSEQKI